MVVQIIIEDNDFLFGNGKEYFATIDIDNSFYKQIGGLSTLEDILKVLNKDLLEHFNPHNNTTSK